MNLVRYNADEMPPLPPEYIKEQILGGYSEINDSQLADIPRLPDDFFQKAILGRFYKLGGGIDYSGIPESARRELGKKILAAKEADRVAEAAWREVDCAITEARRLAHQT